MTGLHILGEVHTKDIKLLNNSKKIKGHITKIIKKYGFKELGSLYHKFSEGGFTGAVTLAESHVTLHTWPELEYLTLDVYVCNYSKDNGAACREVFNEIVNFFQPTKIKKREVKR